jgi:hypothetical protein
MWFMRYHRILALSREVKMSRYRHADDRGERKYISYSFLTLALDGVRSQRHALAALYPRGKNPWYPLDMRLYRPQSRSGYRGQGKNLLPRPGFKPR